MRKDKEKAVNLRKVGKSYLEIYQELGVPRSTLSDWFRDQKWSKELSNELSKKAQEAHSVRIRELNRVRGENLRLLYIQAEQEAKEEFELLKYHPLFISGLMVYWGEGNKSSRNHCYIANTDPLMIKLFITFLEKVCGFKSPRIRAWILLYPDLNEDTCKEYWIKNASLKTEDFNKSIVIKGKHPTKKVSFGVCSVGISSAYLKCKILKWIEMIANDLTRADYIAGMV